MAQGRLRGHALTMLCLRIGLGVLFVLYGWPKISHIGGVIGMWQRFHLFLPPVMGPIHAVVEFFGGILLIVGVLTRLWGLLLAVDMIGALAIVKIPTSQFVGPGGWSLEWLALWVALALLAGGSGSLSLDNWLWGTGAQGRKDRVPQ